jgi:hypothetical protein
MKFIIIFLTVLFLFSAQAMSGIMTWQDLPIQDERAGTYGIPTRSSSSSVFIGFFKVTAFDEMSKISRLIVKLKNGIQSDKQSKKNQPLSTEQISRVKQFYPQLTIDSYATRKDVEATINSLEREASLRYLEEHGS